MTIGFNKPYLAGKEMEYISDAVRREKLSGNGYYTKQCHQFFEKTYGFQQVLLTTSCTDALEMAAILLKIEPGDEVIMPSYTFVSTANAFILRGASIVFADSQYTHPNIDAATLRPLITPRTKAIVVVHYAGIACDMDKIMSLAEEFQLYVVEDAAQAIDSKYKGKPLGGIGHLGCLSFHETKNIICGEGGLLVINDRNLAERGEIIWEKGTNRAAFSRGEIQKYGWIDIGSSFLPSELNAAYLYGQLEKLEVIQEKRKALWDFYYRELNSLDCVMLPTIYPYSTNNAHIFYLTCRDISQRSNLIEFLGRKGIQAVSHYLPLHLSDFYSRKYAGDKLPNSERFSNCIVRLPLYPELTFQELQYIVKQVQYFFHYIGPSSYS